MKPGLPSKDTSLETSADYMPDLIQDRKVHFILEDLKEDTTNAMDEEASEHDDDQGGSSSEEHSSDTDTGDATDASDISEDIVTVQSESNELRGSPDLLPIDGLKIDQLFEQFIELGQHPLLKLHSLDQVTR